jgi:predicted HTH domain antitoxin
LTAGAEEKSMGKLTEPDDVELFVGGIEPDAGAAVETARLISDETLLEAGLTTGDVLVEFACRLFDADKISLWPAARLAGLSRVAFEQALRQRKIAVYRPQPSDRADDILALDRLGV